MPPKRAISRQGFTLIELLVVVAVIGVLASLLMPSMLSSMRSATATDCKNNLRQIHHGLFMYTKDCGFLPAAGYGPQWGCWYDKVELYLRTREVCRCPAKKGAANGYGVNYRYMMGANWAGMTYPYNYLWYCVLPIDTVKRPSGTVYVGDTGWIINPDDPARKWQENQLSVDYGYLRFPQVMAPYGDTDGDKTYPYWKNSPWRPAARHPGTKVNCLFFDSHAEGILVDALVNYNFGDPDCLYDNQ